MNQRIGITLAVLAAAPVWAATTYLSKADGNWTSSATWSPEGVPGNGDGITVCSNKTVTLDSGLAGEIKPIYVGSSTAAAGPGCLIVDNAVLTNGNNQLFLYNTGSSLILTNGGMLVSAYNQTINVGSAGHNGNTLYIGGTNSSGARAELRGFGNNSLSVAGLSNGVIIAEGGVVTNQLLNLGSSAGSACNYLFILNGGRMEKTTSGDARIGGGAGSFSNTVIVSGEGSMFTNATKLYVGSATPSYGNSIVVTNGGKVYSIIYIGQAAGASNNFVLVGQGGYVNSALVLGAASSCAGNYLAIRDGGRWQGMGDPQIGGAAGAVSNWIEVAGTGSDGTFATLDGFKEFKVGAVAGAYGNGVRVGAGGRVIDWTGFLQFGAVNGANSNFIVVADGGYLGGVAATRTLSVGHAAVTGNCVTVENGGMITNVTLNVGYQASSAAGNSVLLCTGGLLEAPTIRAGKDATTVDNAVINRGGIIQFGTVTPTIAVVANNAIVMDSGALAYRGIKTGTLPNLTNNTGAATVGLFTWPAGTTNAFRLNDCFATNTVAGGYTFAYNASDGKQYARLELVNGATELRGQPVTIGAGGTLYVERTAATLRCGVTLADGGTVAVGATNGLSVTVTGGLTVGGTGTLVLPAGLAKDEEFKLINATGGVTGGGNLSSWTDADGKYKLVLKNTTEVWVAPKTSRGTLIRLN